MAIKYTYSVKSIDSYECKEWLLKKHYAKRIPAIVNSFGLYNNGLILQGVCTFGPPARMLNMGYGIFEGKLSVPTMELNRLVINEGLEKNVLSYFVSESIKNLPRPNVVVSYADSNKGHNGYIYQATNWIYTGISSIESIYTDTRTNEILHPRTVVSMYGSRESSALPKYIEISKEEGGKHRYIKFCGNKRQIKEMKKSMKYKVYPYPKGENSRYDAAYKPTVQIGLF